MVVFILFGCVLRALILNFKRVVFESFGSQEMLENYVIFQHQSKLIQHLDYGKNGLKLNPKKIRNLKTEHLIGFKQVTSVLVKNST